MKNKIHHTAIATNQPEKYIKLFEDLGGELMYKDIARDFDCECIFIKFDNTYIEILVPLTKFNHIDRFILKFGDGKLHHIAFLSDNLDRACAKKGALPGMLVEFILPSDDNGMLIEKVKFV